MAVTDTLVGGRSIREGILPVKVEIGTTTSTTTLTPYEPGDLIGIDTNNEWVRADANAGIMARLIVGERKEICSVRPDGVTRTAAENTLTAYAAAVVDVSSGSGTLTVPGEDVGLSETVGEITTRGKQSQRVGLTANTTDDTWVFTGGITGNWYPGNATIGLGSVGSTSAHVLMDVAAVETTATVDYARLLVASTNLVTVPTGTTAVAASLRVNEPNLTATGTITSAATLYVNGQPSEGVSDYAALIDLGASDGTALAFRSSDVATGLSSLIGDGINTGDFGLFFKQSATLGGLTITALGENNASLLTVLRLAAIGGQADGTKAAGGRGMVEVVGIQHDGSNGAANVDADGNVFAIRGYKGGSEVSLFLFDEDGESHQDIGTTAWLNFDDYDDVAILNTMAHELSTPEERLKRDFGLWTEEHREQLEAMKVVKFNDDGHHFMATRKLSMLLIGAIRQLGARLTDATDRLTASEKKLSLLESGI